MSQLLNISEQNLNKSVTAAELFGHLKVFSQEHKSVDVLFSQSNASRTADNA